MVYDNPHITVQYNLQTRDNQVCFSIAHMNSISELNHFQATDFFLGGFKGMTVPGKVAEHMYLRDVGDVGDVRGGTWRHQGRWGRRGRWGRGCLRRSWGNCEYLVIAAFLSLLTNDDELRCVIIFSRKGSFCWLNSGFNNKSSQHCTVFFGWEACLKKMSNSKI